MPNRTYYEGLPLADAVRRLAEDHYDPNNRHISRDKPNELLLRAAAAIRTARSGYELLRDAADAFDEVT